MRGRVEQLKWEVRRMFQAGNAMDLPDDTVTLVDALERLGVDNHFREEIDVALSRIHGDGEDDTDVGSSHNLHAVALRFCLLRQHGFWVPTDVFDKFRDGMRGFNAELRHNPRGLLTLYNAAHMAVPGEAVLDDAMAFARRHLEADAARGKLRSPLAEQVCRALETPGPRFMRRLETMHYITEYEREEGHNATVLELARLDLNLVRSLHLKELRSLTLWWRNLYNDVKLPYARDRIVEPYFYACGIFHEEENSHIRIVFTKVFVLLGLMDDTYDVHATLEECQMLNEAIQRWDETAATSLPKYMRMLYIKTLRNINGIEDILEPFEKYRMMAYIQKQYKLQSNNYLQEAKWSNGKHIPSLKEHADVTLMSTGLPFLFSLALMAAGQVVVTKESLEWALSVPTMVRASGEIGRLLNDISSYKRGKNKNDVASTVESYMKEHGATGEEAMAAIKTMVEQAWRRINGACMELGRTMQPALQWLVAMTRMLEVFYLHGRDGLTYGYDIKEIVAFLFLKQVPV